uniref:Uracil-DNA glycosylase n=1 Tax=Pithovirus LCPAC101 TaxID=2506586 RepID=A0A481Z231_9VIRU|nr:MAG: uracil-DNA glycosylase [Pithovirus LCPAC101]
MDSIIRTHSIDETDREIDGYEPIFYHKAKNTVHLENISKIEDLLPKKENLTELLRKKGLLGRVGDSHKQNTTINESDNNINKDNIGDCDSENAVSSMSNEEYIEYKDGKINEKMSVYDIILNYPPRTWEKAFYRALSQVEEIDTGLEDLEERLGKTLPTKQLLFRAFDLCPIDKLKVVIVGQDPYHTVHAGKIMANGMAFSTNKGFGVQKSLKNIYKEISRTHPNFIEPDHGDLSSWAKQGVLLLNTSLTVAEKKAGSHKKLWIGFIHKMLMYIQEENKDLIFVLWGKHAEELQSKQGIISSKITSFITSHPSPFSCRRGFMGCNHFIDINEKLEELNLDKINWNLD